VKSEKRKDLWARRYVLRNKPGPGLTLRLRTSWIMLSMVFVIVLSLITGCTEPDSSLRAGFESGRYRSLVAFGDSIVEGYAQPEGWPEMLARDLGQRYPAVVVLNAGISGNTAGDGLSRLERDVLSRDPDLVLISFGLNDMKRPGCNRRGCETGSADHNPAAEGDGDGDPDGPRPL
jgi:hypothetical protein